MSYLSDIQEMTDMSLSETTSFYTDVFRPKCLLDEAGGSIVGSFHITPMTEEVRYEVQVYILDPKSLERTIVYESNPWTPVKFRLHVTNSKHPLYISTTVRSNIRYFAD